MNLFNNLRNNYGQNTVKIVRDLENTGKKIARYRNHLVFTLRCKELRITPRSLRLKCPIKTDNAREIIAKAQQQLLRERIRIINNKIVSTNERKSVLENDIKSRVSDDTKHHVIDHVTRKCENEFQKTRWRHQQKLDRLIGKSHAVSSGFSPRRNTAENPELGGEQLKKWVVLTVVACTSGNLVIQVQHGFSFKKNRMM